MIILVRPRAPLRGDLAVQRCDGTNVDTALACEHIFTVVFTLAPSLICN
jgi:hypothetical protein